MGHKNIGKFWGKVKVQFLLNIVQCLIVDFQGLPYPLRMEVQIFSTSPWTNPSGQCWTSGKIHIGWDISSNQWPVRPVLTSQEGSLFRKERVGWDGGSAQVKWRFYLSPSSTLKIFQNFISHKVPPWKYFRMPEGALAELTPSAVNRSTNSHILIYNRVSLGWILDSVWVASFFCTKVPKCGSTTVEGVLMDLSRWNNFSIHFSNNSFGYFICLFVAPWNPCGKRI